jgi:hypothetical protein
VKSAYLAVSLLLLGGCATQETPRVPTVSVPASAPAPGQTPKADSDYDKALRYTRCMTENGAPHPDPVAGEALVTFEAMDLSETNGDVDKLVTLMTARRDAHEKCRQHLPATWPVKIDPAEIARSRAFGECLRQRGVHWPEPDANGLVDWPTNVERRNSPEYQAAESACRHLVDDPASGSQG